MSLMEQPIQGPRTSFLWLGFITAVMAAAAVAWAAYGESTRYDYWRNWLSHTLQVIDALDAARAASFEASTTGENYYQSGDRQQQLKFRTITSRLQQISGELRFLSRDNVSQQARLNQFDPILHRLSTLARGPAIAKRGHSIQEPVPPELAAALSHLRELLQQMSTEENRLLQARLTNARIASDQRIMTIALGGSFIFIWLLFLSVYAAAKSKRLTETAQNLANSREQLALAAVERELRKVDEQYRALVQNVQDYAILMLDVEGRVLTWNEGAQRIKGYDQDEIVGRDFSCFYTPEDIAADKPAHRLAEARKTGRSEDEGWRLRKDGSRFWASTVITALYGPEGGIQGFSKITRDMTDRKLAEEKFRALLESAPDALVIVGKEGGIELVNSPAEALFGYRREELLGQPIEVLVPERFRTHHREYRNGYFASPQPRPMGGGLDLMALRKDGTEFGAEIRLSPIPTPAGTLVAAAVRDITERKQLQEEQYRRIKEANRLKSEFLANMSHELRTPLNAVIGFASLMHEEKVGVVNDNQKEYLGDILGSSRHLLHLINDVLDLAKIEAGKMEFRSEPFDLQEAVREVTDILRGLAAERKIQISSDISPEITIVNIDPAKLKQVLYNYLSNALKFTPERGAVTVRIRPEANDRFRIEVEDSGIGIAAKDMHRLFVEFQQLDGGRAKKYGGTGLGLSLTKRIVEAQGGTVSVQSVVGGGSIFAAVLPRVLLSSEEAIAPLPAAPNIKGRPILVIEDDRADREWLVRTLTNAGYLVEAAVTGAEAVKLCNEQTFAAITLDLLLPDASGWDVLREIRSIPLNRQVPAIAVTVSRDRGLSSAFVLQDYLVKPVNDTILLQALRQAGVHSGNGAVLIVDNDRGSLKLISANLNQLGYRAVGVESAEEALELVHKDRPAVIVLELLLAGMSGFQFLDKLRRTPAGRHIPVIVWTMKGLNPDEQRRLHASAQTVMQRNGINTLLEELGRYLTKSDHGPSSDAAGGAS
jgi:PAS domain S-box-containing protein